MWVGKDGWTSTEFSFASLRGTVSPDTSCCNINSPYYLAIERKNKQRAKWPKQRNNRLKRKQKVNERLKKNKKMFTFALLGCFIGR